MSVRTLPRHRFTGQRAVGFRKDGRPIFPIAGGSEPPDQKDDKKDDQRDQQQNSGPVEATDEHGAGLGYPKDTRVEDMNADQKANYWRTIAKKKTKEVEQRDRELADARAGKNQQSGDAQNGQQSGTVRDQQQSSGTQADTAAIRREAAEDAASATLRTALALRGKKADEIDEMLDMINPAKFTTSDFKVDPAKVASYVEKYAPADSGSNGTSSDYGAGRREGTAPDRKAAAKAEAEKRFAGRQDQPNRGHLGGLRR